MRTYDTDELLSTFERALRQVWAEEGRLIARGTSERAVAHRIALYLEPPFADQGLRVDCEYNRNGLDAKRVTIQLEALTAKHRQRIRLAKIKQGHSQAEAERITKYMIRPAPDIILHRREENDANLLMIELKMVGDQRGEEGELYDMEKLRVFTEDPAYHYQLGLFVELGETSACLTHVQGGRTVGQSTIDR